MSDRCIRPTDEHVWIARRILSYSACVYDPGNASYGSTGLASISDNTIFKSLIRRMRVIECRVRVGSVHITHRYASMDHEAHFELFSMHVRCREQTLDAETCHVTPTRHNHQYLLTTMCVQLLPSTLNTVHFITDPC